MPSKCLPAEVNEIGFKIYEKLMKEDAKSTFNYTKNLAVLERTEKLKMAKASYLNSIGKQLGKCLSGESKEFERLFELWEFSKVNESEIEFRLKSGREVRRIITIALSVVLNKNYRMVKDFVENVTSTLDDWETVDTLAVFVVSKLAVKNREDTFEMINRWITSENKWVRRLAVATIPPYIRAKKDEIEICLRILDKVMFDKDTDVRKAVSWALREMSKRDPEIVFQFLEKWASTKIREVQWIIRDGMRKLDDDMRRKLNDMMVS